MFGKTRRQYVYFACQPDPRHHAHQPWYPDHPASVLVREDALTAAVHEFFATRILGPHRRDLLAAQLAEQHATTDESTDRAARLTADDPQGPVSLVLGAPGRNRTYDTRFRNTLGHPPSVVL